MVIAKKLNKMNENQLSKLYDCKSLPSCIKMFSKLVCFDDVNYNLLFTYVHFKFSLCIWRYSQTQKLMYILTILYDDFHLYFLGNVNTMVDGGVQFCHFTKLFSIDSGLYKGLCSLFILFRFVINLILKAIKS